MIRSLGFWVASGEQPVPGLRAARCKSRETECLPGTQGSVFSSEATPIFVIWFRKRPSSCPLFTVLLTLQVTKDNGTSGELTGETRSQDLCELKEVDGQAQLQMGVDTK